MKKQTRFETWFAWRTRSTWDSPQMALRFILGLFLAAGLFSFTRYGIEQIGFLLFAQKETVQIDLREKNLPSEIQGHVSVTGYPIRLHDEVKFDATSDLLIGHRYIYDVLLPTPDHPRTNQAVIVVQAKSLHEPDKRSPSDQLVTYEGVVGFHGTDLPPLDPVQDSWLAEYAQTTRKEAVVLDTSVTIPSWSRLLAWLIPTGCGFLLGWYWLLSWAAALRRDLRKH